MNILLTGSSSGIGLQLARDYLAQGHHVTCCARNAATLLTLQAAYPTTMRSCLFDVADLQQCRDQLESSGPFDLVILNAGTCEYIDVSAFDAESFARVVETNVLGVANCLELLLPKIEQSGSLALMGSSSSFLPLPRAEAYGASKAAIEYLARTLAIGLKRRDIAVSYIAPGFVETPLTDRNDFPMPMRVDVEFASRRIRDGLARRRPEIHFPKAFTWTLKLVAMLPDGLQRRLIGMALAQ